MVFKLGGSGWGDGSGYGYYDGGGWDTSCNVGVLNGEVIITTSYAGGDASAMLLDTEGNGPYNSVWTTLNESGGGAAGDYYMTFCDDPSQMNLVGAYDSNFNGIIDPAGDTWGVYVVEGLDANPIELLLLLLKQTFRFLMVITMVLTLLLLFVSVAM